MQPPSSVVPSDADRAELRATVRRFLTSCPPERAWDRMASELGLQGLGLLESVGGSGGGPQELAVVHSELGRVLAGEPFLATVALAATALLAAGDSVYLPAIAAGDTVATLALHADVTATRAGPALEGGATEAGGAEGGATDGWLLTGRCDHVLAGAEADLILVPATSGSERWLFAVVAEDLRGARTPLVVLDSTRPQARLDLRDCPARLVTAEADDVLARTRDLAAVALAAEQVGAAEACLEMALDYAKLRVQFGRVIGSFQAVKHLLVDLAIELELARSAMEEATFAAATGDSRLPMLASLAQATCSEAFVHISEENIQIHGGIGITWEHPAHHYFRRATWSEPFLGSPAEHRARIAELLTRGPH